MVLRVSRVVPDKEELRVHAATQEKRVNMENLALMALMEKMAKVAWQDLLETEEHLAEEGRKVPKVKQETEERWEFEETQV